MVNFIHKYWWLAILLTLLPFALNIIIQSNTPAWITSIFRKDVIVGEPKDWLMFWGSYISGAATIIVIYITLKNQEELKKLQLDIVKHTQEKEFVKELIDDIQKINDANNPSKLVAILEDFDILKQRAYLFRNESSDAKLWFWSKYMLEIRDGNSIADYYHIINSIHDKLIKSLDIANIIFKLELDVCIKASELKMKIEELQGKENNEPYFWQTVYEKYCTEFIDEDGRQYDLEIENIERELLNVLIDDYATEFHKCLVKGATLIRIKKEELNNSMNLNRLSQTDNNIDDDLPF